MRTLPLATLLILAATAAPAAAAPAPGAAAPDVDLVPLGRTAEAGEAGAEISAFDPRTDRAFVTNGAENALDIFDLSDPASPEDVDSVDLSDFGSGAASVDVSRRRGGIVAVAVQADGKTDEGTVQFFDTDGDRIGSVPVGVGPDNLTFTNDDKTLLVANEGEPNDAYSVDPEGTVSVIDMRRGVKNAEVRTATLGEDDVELEGPVRIFGPGASQAQDLEPEYIAVAPDDETAYVSLQENNAIGILDIDAASFEVVKGLGFKDHSLSENGLDPSDEDGPDGGPEINIRTFDNLFGIYQPDSIAAFEQDGEVRIVTANEGDARDYDGFSEEERVKDLELDEEAFPGGLQDDDQLGRLTVTTTLGDTDDDGEYEELYAFGGRSMGVLDARANVIADTGDELEQFTAEFDPDTFNTNHTPEDDGTFPIDNRSDNKGPEPEGIDTGEIDGSPYAFLSNERQGGIFAYDVAAPSGTPRMAGYVNTREEDLGPEGLLFVSAKDSPTRRPLLLSANEITGTLNIIEVRSDAEGDGSEQGGRPGFAGRPDHAGRPDFAGPPSPAGRPGGARGR